MKTTKQPKKETYKPLPHISKESSKLLLRATRLKVREILSDIEYIEGALESSERVAGCATEPLTFLNGARHGLYRSMRMLEVVQRRIHRIHRKTFGEWAKVDGESMPIDGITRMEHLYQLSDRECP